jgi:hypothetical protein
VIRVSERTYSVEEMARQLIENCRRDIAAAVVQIEAARAILLATRWLLERWRHAEEISARLHLRAYDETRASGFVAVEEEEPPRRRRRWRAR